MAWTPSMLLPPHRHEFVWHEIVGANYVERVYWVSVTCSSCGLRTKGTTPMPTG